MKNEKKKMKQVLASALLLSVCSMQAPALALPTLSASAEIISGNKNAVEGGYQSITSNASFSNVTFSENYLGETYYNIKAEDFKLSDFDIADSANRNASGGGVFYVNQKGITVDVKDSIFTNNQALGNPNATDVDGAAISLVNGTVNIENCIFSGNISEQGAINQYSYKGGLRDSVINITGSEFTNNTARDVGALGIFNVASIAKTAFTNNRTLDTSGDGGGAIFLGSEANTSLNEVTFTTNTSAVNGGAISMRDFIQGDNSNAKLDIINSTFTGNVAAKNGGAIYNTFFNSTNNPDYVTITGGKFEANKAKNGGAIYNDALESSSEISSAIIDNVVFDGNIASVSGGAIYTKGGLTITNSKFTNNHLEENTAYSGGAIFVNAYNQTVDISNSLFEGNTALTAGADGAAISLREGKLIVTDSQFIGNKADQGTINQYVSGRGSEMTISGCLFQDNEALDVGAIGVFQEATIKNTQFINNKATLEAANGGEGGGAIFVGSEGALAAIENVVFNGNYSASVGGAIATRNENRGNNTDGSLSLNQTTFTSNSAVGNGGAIYSAFDNVSIIASVFEGNSSGANGGAIYNAPAGIYTTTPAYANIVDTSFTNNTAAGLGGAIYANSDVYINAIASNVTFSGNTDKNGANDIYMAGADSTLYLNATEGQQLVIDSGVDGDDYKIIINSGKTKAPSPARLYAMRASSGSGYGGTIVVGGAVAGADIEHNAGVLKLSEVSNVDESTISVASGATLDTVNGMIEDIGSNITLQDGATLKVDLDASGNNADNFSGANVEGSVVIDEINAVGSTGETNLSTLNIAEALGLSNANVTISQAAMDKTYTVMTPIRKMNGIIDQNGMMTFAPTGNGYKDFNPAVMAAPVAAQLGGYLTQLNAYNQAFHNMDMYMLMTSGQRKALKNQYKVASLVGGVEAAHKDKNMWFNPYASYEKVKLDDGPKVSNAGYGMFFGGETDLKELGHGWDGVFGAYAGYNGSHQSYDGVSIYQNGGSLGLVGMAYKDNFFTGLTINIGANAATADTKFGNEDFSMLMGGIASKSGYNFEFKDGKLILQPSLMLSYTAVNTFDYDNGANVDISSDVLQAIHLEPGLKVIGNLKNGWQPYAGVSFVWNIMDKAKFQANNVSLPEISVKPYVKYGVGVRKSWGERLSGFLQTYITNGGRNGVGFQAGFSFAIGKDYGSKVNTSGKLPEIKKLELSLKNTNHS